MMPPRVDTELLWNGLSHDISFACFEFHDVFECMAAYATLEEQGWEKWANSFDSPREAMVAVLGGMMGWNYPYHVRVGQWTLESNTCVHVWTKLRTFE